MHVAVCMLSHAYCMHTYECKQITSIFMHSAVCLEFTKICTVVWKYFIAKKFSWVTKPTKIYYTKKF